MFGPPHVLTSPLVQDISDLVCVWSISLINVLHNLKFHFEHFRDIHFTLYNAYNAYLILLSML